MKSLKERLATWHEFDSASFELGVVIGLWPEWEDLLRPKDVPHDNWGGTKHIFWTTNVLGDALADLLIQLVKYGVLEYSEEHRGYRYNMDFKGSWEL